MYKKGFVLLVVIFVCFLMSTITLTYWYNNSLKLDIIFERERQYKHFYLARLILNYGLSFVKNNFKFFMLESSKKKLFFNVSNVLDEKDLIAEITIESKNNKLLVRADLRENKIIIYRLYCHVLENNIEDFSICPIV